MELLDLNDDVLLYILRFLDPTDEFALSNTCTRFKKMCQSGWSSLTLNLGQETKPNERKLKLTEDEKEILEMSGDMMQNLHISVDFSGSEDFDQPSLYFLKTQSKKWNLKKFCFDALNVDVRIHGLSQLQFWRCGGQFLQTMMRCLYEDNTRNANLETLSLSIQGWRYDSLIYRVEFVALLSSPELSASLKHFTLDCFFSRQRRFMPSDFLYDHEMFVLINQYIVVIGMFENLRKLEINSFYLTNYLLEVLSQPDHVNLQSMTLVLDRFHDDEITLWPQLVNSSPSLKVTVEAFYDVSCENVCRVLSTCVPVVSWKVYSFPVDWLYDRNKLKDKFHHLCLYRHTLQSVAVQNGSTILCHSALLDMVIQCSKLQTFYFQGQISCNAILKMASLQRQWLKLSVLERDIRFPRSWRQSNEENVERLCEEISMKLGSKWKPELESTYKAIFNRPVST